MWSGHPFPVSLILFKVMTEAWSLVQLTKGEKGGRHPGLVRQSHRAIAREWNQIWDPTNGSKQDPSRQDWVDNANHNLISLPLGDEVEKLW